MGRPKGRQTSGLRLLRLVERLRGHPLGVLLAEVVAEFGVSRQVIWGDLRTLARAGYRAIQNGFDALFITAAELIDDLSAAFRQGAFAHALTKYTHPDLLIVDEVGYLTYGNDAANMLFHVVNERHKTERSMIFTTNKALGTWGRVLHDDDLAVAIIDRVLERGRLLQLDGPSMRTKHLGIDDPASPEATSRTHARSSASLTQRAPPRA